MYGEILMIISSFTMIGLNYLYVYKSRVPENTVRERIVSFLFKSFERRFLVSFVCLSGFLVYAYELTAYSIVTSPWVIILDLITIIAMILLSYAFARRENKNKEDFTFRQLMQRWSLDDLDVECIESLVSYSHRTKSIESSRRIPHGVISTQVTPEIIIQHALKSNASMKCINHLLAQLFFSKYEENVSFIRRHIEKNQYQSYLENKAHLLITENEISTIFKESLASWQIQNMR